MCFTSYLADFFDKVNELNLSLQGNESNILIMNMKLQAFQQNLSLWSKGISHGCTDRFSCLNDFFTNNEIFITVDFNEKSYT